MTLSRRLMMLVFSGVAMSTRLRHGDNDDVDRHVADKGAHQLTTAARRWRRLPPASEHQVVSRHLPRLARLNVTEAW